jgi:hypothetical protein
VLLEPDRVAQRVHRERVLGGALGAEEVHLRAERQDQVVVGQRVEPVEADLPRVQVDRGDGGLVDDAVLLPPDQVAQRVPDGAGLEQSGRELVKQRLERVVVVPVHDHDVRVRLRELLRRADPGKAAAEDEHARSVFGHSGPAPKFALWIRHARRYGGRVGGTSPAAGEWCRRA